MPVLPLYGNSHVYMLAQLCRAYGLRHVVISPGSRNSPLIRAFHEEEGIATYIIPDERSAAYFALGIAQHHREPVAMVCTSGTAALNYLPALAEAYHQRLPLLAITADRPAEWVGQNDGQTINQKGIFRNFTVLEETLPVSVQNQADLWHLKRIVRDLFAEMVHSGLPVHLNVPLREPLQSMDKNGLAELNATRFEKPAVAQRLELPEEIAFFRRILLVVGQQGPDPELMELLSRIAIEGQAIVLTEPLSNVRHEKVLCSPDGLLHALRVRLCERYNPDLIISFGDMLVSKPLKQWLRTQTGAQHWIVNPEAIVPDTFQSIDRHFRTSRADFLQAFSELQLTPDSGFIQEWAQAYANFAEQTDKYAQSTEWSDFKAFHHISRAIPDESLLHLGNSSVVRYAHLFPWKDGISFFGNRGTSGIDGTVSTALGMASQTEQDLFLITGDVAFIYDSNALWNDLKGKNLRIILINNGGGNIFDLIAGPGESGIPKQYLRTGFGVGIADLCRAFGLEHHLAGDADSLSDSLTGFISRPGPALLEISTDPDVNAKVWKDYFTLMKNLI